MLAILSFAVANSTPQGTIGPDFALLVVGASRPVADRLDAAVRRAGIDDMRSSFGFVIRALADSPQGLTELAERLGVTKQAAIKVIDEMEARGFLAREPHPADRRAKILALTDKGRRVREAALAESRRMERELRCALGDADVDALRRVLVRFSGEGDGARPVW
ncbi:MarR family winged helix-turn-helix transcriptional regulator [Candidatus Solirubrobacter pratensis]|uniref:MarR family winged helix-turn-helix transcriptional regulator n=1 Tax=Candidatus Solirubrobacter pratensis TaxID=1298857 RepID=UPI0003FD1678|nr:MarR family transcriptional regulator [Candidatus Solirubrobacter pratensis]